MKFLMNVLFLSLFILIASCGEDEAASQTVSGAGNIELSCTNSEAGMVINYKASQAVIDEIDTSACDSTSSSITVECGANLGCKLESSGAKSCTCSDSIIIGETLAALACENVAGTISSDCSL